MFRIVSSLLFFFSIFLYSPTHCREIKSLKILHEVVATTTFCQLFLSIQFLIIRCFAGFSRSGLFFNVFIELAEIFLGWKNKIPFLEYTRRLRRFPLFCFFRFLKVNYPVQWAQQPQSYVDILNISIHNKSSMWFWLSSFQF